MYIQPYSIVKDKLGMIGLYDCLLGHAEDSWHKCSFPHTKKWFGKDDDFKVIAPPIQHEIGDTVRILCHLDFDIDTWAQNYKFIEGMLIHWTTFTDVATVMIEGEEEMINKNRIFPLKFGNIAYKSRLERGD